MELDKDKIVIEYFESGAVHRKVVPYKAINDVLKFYGYEYYEDGNVKYEGILQRGGLYEGRYYYPNGKLKFAGRYNEREINGGYYGPPFPVNGSYYSEDGELIFQGRFRIQRLGSLGYPKVIFPEGFML